MTRRVGAVLLAAALAASLFLPWFEDVQGAFFGPGAGVRVTFTKSGWQTHGWLSALLTLGALAALVSVAERRVRRLATALVAVALAATLLDLAIDDELVAWGALISVALATALVAELITPDTT